jgi:hypothetical protein
MFHSTLVYICDYYNSPRIGSGTGLFTRALLDHPDWSEALASLHAVDPNEGMREVFASVVTDPRVKLTDGTFDNTGAEDEWADFVIMAAVGDFSSMLLLGLVLKSHYVRDRRSTGVRITKQL